MDLAHINMESKLSNGIEKNELDYFDPDKKNIGLHEIAAENRIDESYDVDKRIVNTQENTDYHNEDVCDKVDLDKRIETASEPTEEGNLVGTDSRVHRYIECRNQGLEGKRHPVTGVRFEKKIVDDGTGELVEGVFPVFEAEFETRIPKELYKEGNDVQFKKANEDLLEKINTTPELKNKFNEEQLAQIKDGETPDGYVWHHNEEAGVLQLVDFEVHTHTGHTGGRMIWGGGY